MSVCLIHATTAIAIKKTIQQRRREKRSIFYVLRTHRASQVHVRVCEAGRAFERESEMLHQRPWPTLLLLSRRCRQRQRREMPAAFFSCLLTAVTRPIRPTFPYCCCSSCCYYAAPQRTSVWNSSQQQQQQQPVLKLEFHTLIMH